MQPEQPGLERRYRRLLRAFPRGYREHRGEEMLATLLETAKPGQQRPSTHDTVELLQGALRERLGMHSATGLQAGVRIAGPISLAVASANSIHTWILNPATTALTVVAGAWVAATLALVLLPRLMAAMIGVAWITTLGASLLAASASDGTIAVAGDEGLIFPRLHPYTYAVEVVCGLTALIAALTVSWRPSPVERIAVGVAVASTATLTILSDGFGQTAPPEIILRDPSWMSAVRLLPVALLVAGLVVVVLRRSTALSWAGLLLLVAGPVQRSWRGPTIYPDLAQWQASPIGLLFGRGPLALFPGQTAFFGGLFGIAGSTVLGASLVTAVFLADANRRSARPRDGRSALSTLSGLALGAAGGLCAYVLADTGYHGDLVPGDLVAAGAPVVAALIVPWVPLWLRRPLILAALAGVLAVAYSRAWATVLVSEFLVVLVLLLVIAVADVRGRGRLVGTAAAGAVVLGVWLHWLYMNDLWPIDSSYWQSSTMPLVGAVVVLFALWWAPVVIIRASRGWVGAAFAFVAGLLWLALQLHLATDTGALVAALTSVAVLVFAARIVVRRLSRRITGTA